LDADPPATCAPSQAQVSFRIPELGSRRVASSGISGQVDPVEFPGGNSIQQGEHRKIFNAPKAHRYKELIENLELENKCQS
jgi:hypothetical protein